jgi:hypothetical protein
MPRCKECLWKLCVPAIEQRQLRQYRDCRGIGVRFPVGHRFLYSSKSPDGLWGSIPSPIIWWQRVLSGFRAAAACSRTDHSPQSSPEIKNVWSYTFILYA